MVRYLFSAILAIAPGLFCQSGSLFAQQGFECPYKIGYSAVYPCTGVPQEGFYIHFNQPYMGSTAVQFDLGSTDPDCQNMGLSHGPPSCGNYWLTDINAPICTIEKPTGSLTFTVNGAQQVCYYKDGLLDYNLSTGCDDLVQDCGAALADFARDFIPTGGDCQLWEGACATESEIWRPGIVIIGADRLAGDFKLGVKGGIITEMVQICKSEWCDYVFADTFRLMPLAEVKSYISANGHLPGCTPGWKIEAGNGFYLEEETVHQQEKIEEIFLHLIELQKNLQNLSARIEKSDWLGAADMTLKPGMVNAPPEIAPSQAAAIDDIVSAQVSCFAIQGAQPGIASGVAGVVVVPASSSYNLSWNGPASGQLSDVNCAGAVKIQHLLPGNYSLTVSDQTGLVGTCIFSIANPQTECGIFNDPDCRKDIINFLETGAFGEPSACRQWEGDPCSHTENIYRAGNVGIGTNVLKPGYSLAVKGGIGTDRLRVELCESSGWCDYVFEDNYSLPSLKEVEKYIREKRHLPGTITQSKVTDEGGFEMRQVKLDQQEKIEEAFLYLIQLSRQKEELKKRLFETTSPAHEPSK